MTLYAFKNGDPQSRYTQERMNSLLALQPFQLIYDGIQRAAKTGVGVTENNIANNNYCAMFILTGSAEIGRVELEVDRDGNGADLILEIREALQPLLGFEGLVLKSIVVPKEFIPDPKGWISIPVGLSDDIYQNGEYWIVVKRNGDATHHNDWMGENATDGNYPAYYRAGDSGAWTENNALHFKVFSGEAGELKHSLYAGTGYTTVEYSDEIVSKVYRYLPPADGPDGGIRDVLTFDWAGEYLKGGDV